MIGGLSRERILRGPARFQQVRQHGQQQRNFLLSLGLLAQPPGNGLKIGFITPKHLGKAHERNQLRRRLKEIVRLSPLPAEAPFWLVLVARHPAARASYDELERHWTQLARRAQLPGFEPKPKPSSGQTPSSRVGQTGRPSTSPAPIPQLPPPAAP